MRDEQLLDKFNVLYNTLEQARGGGRILGKQHGDKTRCLASDSMQLQKLPL